MDQPPQPRSFWAQALPLVVARVLATLVNVALSMVLSRLLVLADVGLYRQLALVTGIALQTLQLGLTTSILHFLPRADPAAGRAYVGFAAMVLSAVGAGSALLFCWAAPSLGALFGSPSLVPLVLPFAIATGLFIASSPIEAVLTARGRPVAAAWAQVLTEVARVGLGFAFAQRAGLSGLAWAFVVVGAVRYAASLLLTLSPDAFRWSRGQIDRQLRFALPYAASIIAAILQAQLHQVFAASHISTEAFAVYSTACIHLPLMAMFFNAVGDALDVRLAGHRAHGDLDASRAVVREALHRLMIVAWPLAAAAIGAAPQLLAALYGPSYAGGANVLRVAVLTLFIGVIPSASVLRSHGRTSTILWMNVVRLAMTWPALLLGFQVAGPIGLIGAHVATEAALRVAQWWIASQLLDLPMSRFVDLLSVVRVALGSSFVVGVSVVAGIGIASPWWSCVVTGVAALAVIGAELRPTVSGSLSGSDATP